ncbi:MAG: DUF1295 domain-containing protein, partial [Caulobacteraceae bacterium]
MLAVMNLAFVYQREVNNTGWVDVFWTFGTGLCGVAVALWPVDGGAPSARQWLIAALVTVWSLRLGGYIAWRVKTGPEDARYARLRKDWGADYQRRLFRFVQPQAPAAMILCLSVLMAAQRPGGGLTLQDWLGAAILLIAIAGEALADRQLQVFKDRNTVKGAICEDGLWAWSRHPNYFFEWLGWCAYPVIAADFSGEWPLWWLSLSGPVAMFLILRFLTGVPPLEKAMAASRGAAFTAYQTRVSPFFPLPPKA